MLDHMKRLIELFAPRCYDRSTLDELYQMVADRKTWHDAQDILDRVQLTHSPGKGGLLAGRVELELTLHSGQMLGASLDLPPGSPGRPPSDAEMAGKFAGCGEDVPGLLDGLDWSGAATLSAVGFIVLLV